MGNIWYQATVIEEWGNIYTSGYLAKYLKLWWCDVALGNVGSGVCQGLCRPSSFPVQWDFTKYIEGKTTKPVGVIQGLRNKGSQV